MDNVLLKMKSMNVSAIKVCGEKYYQSYDVVAPARKSCVNYLIRRELHNRGFK